jgi:serine/threonine-protein kinase
MNEERDVLEERAAASLERARAAAPDLPETHLAAAVLAAERCDFSEATSSLVRALGIAPTCAEAHQGLGRLQCEAGRADEGGYRLRLSLELDPTLHLSRLHLAQRAALDGDRVGYDALMAELAATGIMANTPVLGTRLRAGLWFGRGDEVRQVVADASGKPTPQGLIVAHLGRFVLGEIEADDFDVIAERGSAMIPSVRFRAIFDQLLTEVYCLRGYDRRALRALCRAAEGALVDVDWLRRCPSLEPIRQHPEFRRCADLVRGRAAAIWQ